MQTSRRPGSMMMKWEGVEIWQRLPATYSQRICLDVSICGSTVMHCRTLSHFLTEVIKTEVFFRKAEGMNQVRIWNARPQVKRVLIYSVSISLWLIALKLRTLQGGISPSDLSFMTQPHPSINKFSIVMTLGWQPFIQTRKKKIHLQKWGPYRIERTVFLAHLCNWQEKRATQSQTSSF